MNTLSSVAKKTAKKYKQIKDIVLFGSAVKGKEDPKDFDVLFIFTESVDKSAEKYFKTQTTQSNLDINSITEKELKDEGFIAKESILLEGISLLDDQPIANREGFSSFAFVVYDLQSTKGSVRTRFYYALQGRKEQQGFLDRTDAVKFSENTILCRYQQVEQVKSFLNHWNIPFTVLPALLPKRLEHIVLKRIT